MSISTIVAARVIHVAFGGFWMGGMITVGFFLLPALRDVDRLGVEFAALLMARTRLLMIVFAASGVVAVVAGLLLYEGIWAGTGFSGPALWYAMGGHIAILAVIVGAAVAWPAAHRLTALARAIAGQVIPPTPEQIAVRDRLMTRITWVTQLGAALLVVTITLMAAGRYV